MQRMLERGQMLEQHVHVAPPVAGALAMEAGALAMEAGALAMEAEE